MRTVAAEHFVADLSLRILDHQSSLRALDKNDHGDDHHRHQQQEDDETGRQRPGAAELQRTGQGGGKVRHNTGEDDQRNTITDAARGYLFPQPHEEHGAANQRDYGGGPKEKPGIYHGGPLRTGGAFQPDRNAIALERGQQHGAISGILVDLLASRLALFFHRLEIGRNRGQQLHDNRRRNIGHDAQREDRHAAKGATGEHIEDRQQAAAWPWKFPAESGDRSRKRM